MAGLFDLQIDFVNNLVAVRLPAAAGALTSQLADIPHVSVGEYADPIKITPADGSCTDRFHCGWPLRGGISVGVFPISKGRSIGFTAKAGDGSKWIYTAGHCVTTNQVDNHTVFGHGEQSIGDARDTYYSPGVPGQCDSYPGVDAARIRVNSSYWNTGFGGYVYRSANDRVEVDNAVISMSYFVPGQNVCFGGENVQPGQDTCGVVSTVSAQGFVNVSGAVVCKGDSGRPTTHLGNGQRIAMGLLAGFVAAGGASCSTATGTTFFSPLPAINDWMDDHTASNVRVVTQ